LPTRCSVFLKQHILLSHQRFYVTLQGARWRPGIGWNRRQPVGEHRGENVDHLPIAVVDAGELAPYALHGGRQHPFLEGCAVAPLRRAPGLRASTGTLPGVIDRIATLK
jgi:hypothetical protein